MNIAPGTCRPRGAAASLLFALLIQTGLGPGCSREEKPHLLLITLDTVRADHIGCYGRKPGLTPAIDALAGRGVRFQRAVAPAPITLPSHVSMLTGRDPVRHGVRDNSVYILEDDAVTLAEMLREAGYRTAASVASIALSDRFGVRQGFESFDQGNLIVRNGQEGGTVERDGAEVTREAIRFLDTAGEDPGPFFFWAHYYDPHEPYVWHEDIDPGPAATPYESEVRYVDVQVGRLLDHLNATGLGAGTVVIVASDHGEGLSEHHERSHLVLTYETTLSVPLIFAGPGIAEDRVVESCLGRLIDITPTLLDLAGVPPPEDVVMDGTSLRPLLDPAQEGETGPEIAYFETMGPVSFNWAYLDGVTTLEWKYIRGPVDELYHLPTDPLELSDVLFRHPEVAEKLSRAADAYAAARPETGGIAEMAGRQSELFGALGYLSLDVRARKPTRDAPHPRDMVSILDVLAQAQAAYLQGRHDLALPLYEECVRLSPKTALFHDFLGKTRLRLTDPAGAAAAFLKALEIQPEMIDTRLALGIAQVNTGAVEEAEATFREVIRRAPNLQEGYGYLANLYHRLNRPEQELNTLEAMFRNAEMPDGDEALGLRMEMERLKVTLQGQ